MRLTQLGTDGGEVREHVAPQAVITIGRTSDNDVQIADARISSRHGRLLRRGEGYCYEDLGSRNGSLIERGDERTLARPHDRIPVSSGDRLLLGDLVAPVVLRIDDAPAPASGAASGGTVVASRAIADAPPGTRSVGDQRALRALFRLLRETSGRTDPVPVLATIAASVLEHLPQAREVSVLLRGEGGGFVSELVRRRSGETGELPAPSATLLERAAERREVVVYLPEAPGGVGAGPASVAGLAGAAVVPLLAGQEVIGALHVSSTRATFATEQIDWLAIVGTHVAASLACANRFHALARSEADLRQENQALRDLPRSIVGSSPALQSMLRLLERVAPTDTTVLLQGETGTGKELAARYLHARSRRARRRFAPLNCGAVAEGLLESELFGHKKGAFTGALRDRQGLFESAAGGTVLLDEVGLVSAAMQVKLLRVLQEREVRPVGADRALPIDVRIVAATNRNLEADVRAGRFREDLYYRLAVFPVVIPALRERSGDVALLAETFRALACARHGRWVPGFTTEALEALAACEWPGNVRQLEHEVERAVILADAGDLIGVEHLSPQVTGRQDQHPLTGAALPRGPLRSVMEVLEERVIRRSLQEHQSNRTRTATALGISRQALQVKLARWRARDEGGSK